ncbi:MULTISPECIES: hypothetical protein [Psychrobacter]|uniref:LPS-assembly lipoprotein LptE n=1 Tax=Psychrobacter TaxID=497 RepID=UPI001CB752AC|nr:MULTISPECIES: hypothetical protein [Psychrobacter]
MNPQTLIKAALVAAVLATSSFGLTGCGFHLRGFEAPLHFDVAKTVVNIEDNKTAFPLKLPLSKRLSALGAQVIDGMSVSSDNLPAEPLAAITVKNVQFRRYELVGVLTEIRLVLSADVTYQTLQNGEPVTLSNPIQVERSYQYNEASVSTEDQQGSQIRDWLYDSLARRISDQYVAIGLPNTVSTPAKPMIKP